MNEMTPNTCGVAKLVPSKVPYPSKPQAEAMPDPGAEMSGLIVSVQYPGPLVLNSNISSLIVVEPTAMTSSVSA